MAAPVTPSGTPDYYVWRPTGKRLAVHFRKSAMEQIEENVRSVFQSFPPPGGEAAGLLLGSKAVLPDGPAIIIETAEPIRCEHGLGPEFALSANDAELLAAQMNRLKAEGVVVVGLYRTHARARQPEPAVTSEDRELLSRLLPAVASVFLLVRPLSDSQSLAGIFFWHEGRVARESAFIPFPFSDAGPVSPRELAPRSDGRLRVDIETAPWQAAASAAPQKGFSASRWLLITVFGILGAAAGYGVVSRLWAPPPRAAPLSLEARRSQQSWILRWNPDIAGRARAARGVITIRDGERAAQYSLDTVQLSAGEFVYAPETSTVNFKLEAVGEKGAIASESVMAIDPNVKTGSEGQ